MAKQYFNRVFYRTATTITDAATATGTYPDYLVTDWTLLVGGIADKAKLGLDADSKEVMGDGTELTSSEKVPIEITVMNFTAANYATIRAALLNTKLDWLFMDSDQHAVSYAAFGVRAYPKLEITGGEEPKIVIAGERKIGAGVTNTPFKMVTVTGP
jgi:hypothetical protein